MLNQNLLVMKKNFILFICLVMSAVYVKAQSVHHGQTEEKIAINQGSQTFFDRLYLQLGLAVGTKHNDITPMEPTVEVGYFVLRKLYLFGSYSGLYAHYDKDENIRKYTLSQNLGGGLGYTLFNTGNMYFDLNGKITSSVGSSDWKFVCYDIGVKYRIGSGKQKIHFGLSYRHINSRTAGIDNYNGVFGTIGFGF